MNQPPLFSDAAPIPSSPVAREIIRRDSGRARILDRLRMGPALNTELAVIALRYSARIDELRDAGHVIDGEHVEGGVWRYTLVREVRA